MATISLTIPDEQFKKLEQIDIADVFAQFIAEYLEYQEDTVLKRRLQNNPRIQQLTHELAEAV